jgi:hypothetical protein
MSHFDEMTMDEICENLSHNLDTMRKFLDCVYKSKGEQGNYQISKYANIDFDYSMIFYEGRYLGEVIDDYNSKSVISIDLVDFENAKFDHCLEMFFKYSYVGNIREITIPNACPKICEFLKNIFTTNITDARYIGLKTVYIKSENNVKNLLNLCEILKTHFEMYFSEKKINSNDIDLLSLEEGIIIYDTICIKKSNK